MTIDATKVQRDRLHEASEVLGRAFHDDPVFAYVQPDDEKRWRMMRALFPTVVRLGDRHGGVFATAGRVEGAAVWLPPSQTIVGPLQMLRAGMWKWPFALGMGAFVRLMGVSDHLDKLHKRDLGQTAHWYLAAIGVDPPRQGQGVGGALLDAKLAQTDAEGLPSYLETTKETNVEFYRKHGFDVVEEGDLPGDGPRYWTMLRQLRR